MTRHERDDALQDYVDGRLSESACAAFERRLADDPDLRRRVEDYRAIRGALREDPAEVPPGFYARARARFEEAHPTRRPWFRPLSWESLGVAAAALLVAALFLPEWISGSGPASAVDPDSRAESSAAGEDDVAAVDRLRALGDLRKNEAPAEESVREDIASEAEAAGDPSDAFRDEAEPQPAGVKVTFGESEADSEREGEPAPAPVATAERGIALAEGAQAEDAEVARQQQVSQVQPSAGYAVAAPAGVPLPGELADPGTVRVIDDAEEWSALLATPEGRALTGLAPDWERERVVLIGSRGLPVDCSQVGIVAGPRVRLVLTRGTAAATAETGCAVRVPAGDEPVVVEGP
jgi:hypothetical protein